MLVTGGSGFIGSHFVRRILNDKEKYTVFNFDVLSYAGDQRRLKSIEKSPRYRFIKGDIRCPSDVRKALARTKAKTVVHFAAETHVDNSIKTPLLFGDTNVKGTLNLLRYAQSSGVQRFIHISTDEVYGEIRRGAFTEGSPLAPNSPYSASKAACDFFVRSFVRTYRFPAIIVRPCNNFGPWQYPEKFIPVAVSSIVRGGKIPVYAKGLNRREWLYAADCAEAVLLLMKRGSLGEIYNVGSGTEKRNIDIARRICSILRKPEHRIRFVKDRPGHDFRYFLDSSKIRRLGWRPAADFETELKETILWYQNDAPKSYTDA